MFSGLKLYALIGVMVALLGAFGATYVVGRSAGSAACEARWTARETARVAAEQRAIEDRDHRVELAQEENARRAAERTATINTLQEQVDAYEAQLAGDAGCVLSDDDARSLSDIK